MTLPFETLFCFMISNHVRAVPALPKKKVLFASWSLVEREEFIWFGTKSKCQNPSRNATPVLPTAVAETNWKYNFPKITCNSSLHFEKVKQEAQNQAGLLGSGSQLVLS